VIRSRKLLVELMLSVCPSSKTIQDLAASMDVQKVRFKVRHDHCILCGLCVRMCSEQMMAKAIGFVNRGYRRKISTPFDMKSEMCRLCGGCMYICPACESRCQGPEAQNAVCGSCLAPSPTCLEAYDDFACFMGPTGDCGTCVLKNKSEARNPKSETTPAGKSEARNPKSETNSNDPNPNVSNFDIRISNFPEGV
jgi:ferredoxin